MFDANDYAGDPTDPLEGEVPFSDPADDTRTLCPECVHDRHERCEGNGCECQECAEEGE